MNNRYLPIWGLVKKQLEKAVVKNLVLHTSGVVNSMQKLIEKEDDEELLILAAILHDIGWSKVPIDLQKSQNIEDIKKAQKLHIDLAPQVISKILSKLNYSQERINQVIDLVIAHKFQNPIERNKQLLIDADNLSDVLKEQFYEDSRIYKKSFKHLLEIRKKNKFYTRKAKEIFDKEIADRIKEIEK